MSVAIAATRPQAGKKSGTIGRLLAVTVLCAVAGCAQAGDAGMTSASALQAKYAALQERLLRNQYQRPLYLESSESPDGVTGDVYALVSYPFATVGAALSTIGSWCNILILHVNTKYCRPTTAGRLSILDVAIGKKSSQPLGEAYRVAFEYRVAALTTDYLQVLLSADKGPLSTRNYRMVLEAVAVEDGQTFIHFSYSYGYGLVGRIGIQTYLETIGRDKVGFSVAGTTADGQPVYVGGRRGLVERNSMRYFLAIDAYLGARAVAPPARFEQSLRDWFAAIERYPRQLHEMELNEYLDMKRKEYRRQQAAG